MNAFTGVGLAAAAMLLSGLVWSIVNPTARVWPPREPNVIIGIAAWLLTVIVFATALLAGLSDWNYFGWPAEIRWGIGLPLIIIGNIIVWKAVTQLGMHGTSGGKDALITSGFYQFSRNPQHTVDLAILIGWLLLCGSPSASPVVIAGVVALLIRSASRGTLVDRSLRR